MQLAQLKIGILVYCGSTLNFFLNYDKIKTTKKRENWNDIFNALSKEYTSIGFCQL